MSIGNRIRFFREMRGISMQHLGELIGISERYANVRIAQYERGFRTPREDILKEIADILEISPRSLDLNVDDDIGIMQTLFFLEDRFHFTPAQEDNAVVLRILATDLMREWSEQYQRYLNGSISLVQYDNWRYQLDTAPIPSDNKQEE